jgi:glycosyltransferase 2 family protein
MDALEGISARPQREKSRRGWLLLFARWAAALLILGLLVYLLPVAPLRRALSNIPTATFLALLLIYLVALTGGIAKWHVVLNSAGAGLPFSVSAQCYAGGLFGALFLPSIVGGDVVRLAVGISRSQRPAAVITGNVADRILDVAAQLTLVLAGIVLFPSSLAVSFRIPAPRGLLFGSLAAALLLAVTLVALRLLLRRHAIRIRGWLAQLREALRAVSRHPYRLVSCWLLGVSVQGTYLLVTMFLGVSCGLHLPLRVWLFAWPLSKIAAVLPITQGGIGVREAALVTLLTAFGAPAALVLATGIASEGIIIAGGLFAGLAAFLLRRAAPSEGKV